MTVWVNVFHVNWCLVPLKEQVISDANSIFFCVVPFSSCAGGLDYVIIVAGFLSTYCGPSSEHAIRVNEVRRKKSRKLNNDLLWS